MASLREKTVDFFGKAKLLYLEKAKSIAGEDSKLQKLLKSLGERLNSVSDHPSIKTALTPILIFKRMIIAHRSGKFVVSIKTLGLIVFGLLYFITPIDIIPDIMPVLGFTDDISVLLAVYHSVKHEVDDFLDWEKKQV